MRHIVLGTAGHIDHGKTALVKRLTGVDCDKLDEEKKRGITIELGFAPWRLADDLEASIIDVPGHERLVRTMVAGAAGMDLAMLVVAADDGVMPQTREHLDVLRLLAVPAGIVVLTKCDLVDAELLDLVEEDVQANIVGTIFEGQPLVRTSSKTGQGLDELKTQVLALVEEVRGRIAAGPMFLPLDRVFAKPGYGTIGTGTTLRGSLALGDSVEVLGKSVVGGLKVRGLQALGSVREQVSAGMRTAVNLAGKNTDLVSRGTVVATAGAFLPTDSCVAQVEVLSHAQELAEEILIIHLGTTEREARVLPLGADKIAAGATGGVLLRFDRPVAAYAGQRLVLRRPGVHQQATVAGGEVLDPEPPRGKGAVSRAAAQLDNLRGDPKERLIALAKQGRAAGVSASALGRRLPPGEGERAARYLTKKGKLVEVSGAETIWLDTDTCDELARKAVAMVNAHHNAAPMSPGMAEAEVASHLPPPERHLATAIVERAVTNRKLVRDGATLAVPGRGASIDAQAKTELDTLLALFADAGPTPPTDKQLPEKTGLSVKRVKELMSLLRRQKRLTKIGDGLHYPPETLAEIETKVVEALQGGARLTAAELKAIAGGLTRKYAIPLLEYLDRKRVTQRQGDVRVLHPTWAQK